MKCGDRLAGGLEVWRDCFFVNRFFHFFGEARWLCLFCLCISVVITSSGFFGRVLWICVCSYNGPLEGYGYGEV